jgi:hypothetical protein
MLSVHHSPFFYKWNQRIPLKEMLSMVVPPFTIAVTVKHKSGEEPIGIRTFPCTFLSDRGAGFYIFPRKTLEMIG